jgi:hypothetical protein
VVCVDVMVEGRSVNTLVVKTLQSMRVHFVKVMVEGNGVYILVATRAEGVPSLCVPDTAEGNDVSTRIAQRVGWANSHYAQLMGEVNVVNILNVLMVPNGLLLFVLVMEAGSAVNI